MENEVSSITVFEPIKENQHDQHGVSGEKFYEINVITSGDGPIISFTGDSQQSFALWAQKFQDFVEAVGSKWSESEKLGRLKLHLDGYPRQLLNELPVDQKDTLTNTLQALTRKIDSPQKRDLARLALSKCKQDSGESIAHFTERLVPLIDSAYSSLSPAARKERLCEAFLDKIDSQISFLVKLTNAHNEYETARTKALEVESMLASRRKEPQLWSIAESQQQLELQPDQFNWWTPSPSNRLFGQNQQEIFNQHPELGQNQDQIFHQNNFESQPIRNCFPNIPSFRACDYYCTYCERPGHTILRCLKKNWANEQHFPNG